MHKFSIREALKWGWNEAIDHIGFFAVVILVSWTLNIALQMTGKALTERAPFLGFLIYLAQLAIGIMVQLGLVAASLKIFNKEKPREEVFRWNPKWFRSSLGASLLLWVAVALVVSALFVMFIAVLAFVFKTGTVAQAWAPDIALRYVVTLAPLFLLGLLIVIIPILLAFVVFQFFPFFIVERNMGPLEALKASKEITRGSRGRILLLNLIYIGITFLGALAFLVGLFLTIPTLVLANTYVYKKLTDASTAAPPAAPVK